MPEKLLKITYHLSPLNNFEKVNAYLKMPSATFNVLRREIDMYLFQERQMVKHELRTYWIDSEHDQIEIVNQNDYEVFLEQCEKKMHMHIEQRQEDNKKKPAAAPNADDPSNFVIHDGVECDSCGVLPIIGFRYKCVQCPNFDICQRCEGAHKHPDHLMVRMPTNNGPNVIDAWLSGPGTGSHHHRRSGRRFRGLIGQCPLAESFATAAATQTAQASDATESPKESRRDKRHARRNGGILNHIVDMMNTAATAATGEPSQEQPSAPTAEPTAEAAKKAEEEVKCDDKSTKLGSTPTKIPVSEEPLATGNVEEPVAAPRAKEQATPDATSGSSTPLTPIINLENLAQMVNPQYMQAGIEILNNFSEMFAKIIEPSVAAALASADCSMVSNGSTASASAEAGAETAQNPTKQTTSTSSVESLEVADSEAMSVKPTIPEAPVVANVPDPKVNAEAEERRRSESFDQEWQMIDNSANDALINLNSATSSTADASVSPVRDFVQLGELLRQHVNEEEQREQTTSHTQTSQVDTVSTSTSTTSVATNSTSTSTAVDPPAPEEKRQVPIYHIDERINAAVHAMMAMGFSNEGAWLTQLLESVGGNIPSALDIMQTSQGGRN